LPYIRNQGLSWLYVWQTPDIIKDIVFFVSAAFFEIVGCYSFWLYFRMGRSPYWIVSGIISLILFAFLLTKVQTEFAGRSYAVYGGMYIAASLLWLYFVERQNPDHWDVIGAAVCITGAMIILFMPR
jgi:small multidrug resistance family-3 protein